MRDPVLGFSERKNVPVETSAPFGYNQYDYGNGGLFP